MIFVLIFYNNETFPSRNFEGSVSTVILLTLIIAASVDNTELHIYGSGDFEEELKKICQENNNIKYFGVVPNDIVVKE